MRGRKLQTSDTYVYSYLDEEFERLLELWVKVMRSLLWEISLTSITLPESPFQPTHIGATSNKFINDQITRDFIEGVVNVVTSRTAEYRVISQNPFRLPITHTNWLHVILDECHGSSQMVRSVQVMSRIWTWSIYWLIWITCWDWFQEAVLPFQITKNSYPSVKEWFWY